MITFPLSFAWRIGTAAALAALPLLSLALTAPTAHAQFISSEPANQNSVAITREPEFGILTDVLVGDSPVLITRFGTLGNLLQPGNLKWVIFQDITREIVSEDPESGGSYTESVLVYESAAVASSAAEGPVWNDSPLMNFTLLANGTYHMGIVADQEFQYRVYYGGAEVSAGGLILPSGSNGNVRSFANPVYNGGGGVMNSFRAFNTGAAAPEPGSIALLLSAGIPVVGLVRRRKK